MFRYFLLCTLLCATTLFAQDGRVIRFDGGNDVMRIPTAFADELTDNYSYDFYFRQTERRSRFRRLFSHWGNFGDNSAERQEFGTELVGDDIRFRIFDTDNARGRTVDEYFGNVELGTWYHITYVRGDDSTRIYVDCAEAFAFANQPAYANQFTVVGAWLDGRARFATLPGEIDDFTVYGRSLGLDEVCNPGSCGPAPNPFAYYSFDGGSRPNPDNADQRLIANEAGPGPDAVLFNFGQRFNDTITPPGAGCRAMVRDSSAAALNFDGVNDMLIFRINENLPADQLSGADFTVDCHFRYRGTTAVGTEFARLFNVWGTRDERTEFGVEGGRLRVFDFDNRGGTITSLFGPEIVTDQWYRMTYQRSGDSTRIYLDCAEVLAFAHQAAFDLRWFTVGRWPGRPFAGSGFPGDVDELRFYNQPTDAAARCASTSCDADGALLYYSFNEGTPGGDNTGLTTVMDRSGNDYDATLVSFALTGAASNFVAGRVSCNEDDGTVSTPFGGEPTVLAARLYPNPTDGQFTVDLTRDVSFRYLDVLDLTGRRLLRLDANRAGRRLRYDVSALPRGYYYLVGEAADGALLRQAFVRR